MGLAGLPAAQAFGVWRVHRDPGTRWLTGPASAPSADAKASRQHDQDGRPYHSFPGLLAHLGTLTRNELRFAGAPATVPVLAEPTSQQRQAFELIGAAIPLTLRT